MLPEEQAPPGLLDAMSGPAPGGPPAGQPPEIEIGGGEEGQSDADLIRVAIQNLEDAAANEDDDADSAKLTKIVAMLYELISGQQDAQITAMGGKPKDVRSLTKLVGPGA